MRRGLLLALSLAVLCLVGCKREAPVVEPAGEVQPTLSSVTVHTEPGGGEVTVAELNRVLGDGDVVQLEAGRYTLRAAKPGYKPQDVVIDVDGVAPASVVMPLGTGFGHVDVSTNVQGATAFADGRELGPVPGVFELPEGAATIVLRAGGYIESTRDLVIVPGGTAALDVAMSAVPTAGPLAITVSDAKAVIRLDGKKVGAGNTRLASVPFGKHKAVAVKEIAPHVRLYGEGLALVESVQGASLNIVLGEQRRFDGRWLSARDALRREAKRYRSARVGNPVAVRCALAAAAADLLRKDAAFGQRLHDAMRVGDRVVLAAPDGEWVFWKRSAEIGDEYAAMQGAFAGARPYTLPFADEAASHKASIKEPEALLAAVAFALHSARSRLPLMDLAADQLAASAKVFRCVEDGALTVVAQGGEGLLVDGKPASAMGDVAIAFLRPSNAPVSIAWAKKPARLLVAGDGESALSRIPSGGAELRIHEKLIVPFGVDSVSHITRLSWLPEEGKWRVEEIEGTTPMGVSIDLGTDEIGPHAKKGQYKRVWLLRYGNGAAETQRQVATAYTVSDEVKSGRTDRFFRRGEGQSK